MFNVWNWQCGCWCVDGWSYDWHVEAEANLPTFRRRHFQMHEDAWIPLEIPLQFVSKFQSNNIPALVQIMAWRRPDDKPLSEPMMFSLLTHVCVTRHTLTTHLLPTKHTHWPKIHDMFNFTTTQSDETNDTNLQLCISICFNQHVIPIILLSKSRWAIKAKFVLSIS